MIVATYDVLTAGTGRRDFSKAIEYSVAPFSTAQLAQAEYHARGIYESVPTPPFPALYVVPLPLPQEEPGYGYLTSSILTSFSSFTATTNANKLLYVALVRYTAGFAYDGRYLGKYGYGKVDCRVSVGISTEENYRYYIAFSVFSSDATFDIQIELYGTMSKFNRAWIDAMST